MRGGRFALAAVGIALLLWGAWLMLTQQDIAQLFSVAVWLIGVVVVHDGLLAVISAVRHRLRRQGTAPAAADLSPEPDPTSG